MASYTRQSTFSDGDLITAALFNDEYNQLLAAFDNATGHKHDGTVGEGPVISVLGDAGLATPLNKILIDTTNDHIEFWIDVSGTSEQQLYIANGAIVPVTNNDVDLGTNSLQFKDLYIDGTANIDNLAADSADINGGNIDGTVIGATTAAAGTFTTIDASGNVVISGNLTVSGTTTSVNSNEVNIGDNILVLNSDETGTPSQNAGIEIERGTSTNVSLLWNESNDYWTFGSNDLHFPDDSKAKFGSGNSLQIYHIANGNSLIANFTNTLVIRNLADDNDVVIQTDNGSGGNTDYFRADGSTGEAKLYNYGNLKFKTTNVGIDITGTVTSDGVVSDGNVVIDGLLQFEDSGGSNRTVIEYDSNDDVLIKTGTSSGSRSIRFQTEASEAMRIDANARVGIGTASPSTNLHVSSSGDTIVRVTSADGNTALLDLGDVSDPDGGRIFYDSGSNLGFTTASTERMRIDASGNVLIGTTTNAGSGGVSIGQNATIYARRTGGEIITLRRDSTDGALINFQKDGTAVGSIGANAGVMTLASPNGSKHYVANSALFPSANNIIDLGTSSQAYKDLYLSGTVNFGSLSDGTTTITGFVDEDNMSSNSATLLPTQQSVKAYVDSQISSAGGNGISFEDNEKAQFGDGNDLQIYHSGVTSFIKDAGVGNLEIWGDGGLLIKSGDGTEFKAKFITNDAVELYYNNSKKFETTSTGIDVTGNIEVGDSHLIGDDSFDNLALVSSSGENIIVGASNDIYFTTGATSLSSTGTTKLIVKDNGNIGIGTTAPSQPLTVESSVDYLANFESTDTGAGILLTDSNAQSKIFSNNGHLIIGTDINNQVSNSSMRFMLDTTSNAAGSARMVLKEAGLAIGVDSPDTPLHVYHATTNTIAKFQSGDSGAGISLTDNGGTSTLQQTTDTLRIGVDEDGAVANSVIAFRVDGSEKARIDSSGNVGIGDSSPDAKLTIQGDVLARDEFRGEVINYSNNQDAPYLIASTSGYTGATTNWNTYGFQHRFKTDSTGTPRITIDTHAGEALAVANNRNVGIGISAPTSPLHVYNATVDTVANFESGDASVAVNFTASDNSMQITTSSTDGIIKNNGAGNFRLFNNGSERLRINSSGNVGIGTTSPQTMLQVVGSGNSVGSVGGTVGIRQKGDTEHDGITISSSHGNSGRIYKDSSGNMHLYNTGGNPNDFVISNAGNIGVGTSSPADELHVNGSGDTAIRVTTSSTSLEPKLVFVDGSGDYASLEKVNRDIKIKAFNTDVAYFTNSGNVGIGTSSPNNKLTVSGASDGINIVGTNSFVRWNSGNMMIRDEGSYAMGFHTYDGSTGQVERMRITSSGNVGIGTSSPNATLEVATSATTNIDVAHFSNSNGAVKAKFHLAASTGDGQLTLYDGSNNADVLISSVGHSYFNSGGNVGINTSSPTSLVHAKGEQNGTNMHFMAEDTSSGNKGGFWVGNSDLSIEVDSAGAIGSSDIRFVVDGSEMSRITSSGDLLIGKTGTTFSNAGIEARENGNFRAIRDGANVADFNRLTSDGNIAAFYKDGSTVGSIGVDNADNLVIEGNSTHSGIQFGTSALLPHKNGQGGSGADAVIDLGISNGRFKDLYLSGTANVGGITSSGNLTFSPSGDYYAGLSSTNALHFENGTGQTLMSTASVNIRIDANNSDTTRFFRVSANSSANETWQGTELFRVQEDGNIGIGTSSPNSRLEVLQTVTNGDGASLRVINDGSGIGTGQTASLVIGRNFEERNFKIQSSSTLNYGSKPDLIFSTNQAEGGSSTHTEVLRIKNDGNVGIGTSSPQEKLHVNGSINIASASPELIINDNTATAVPLIRFREIGVTAATIKTTSQNLIFAAGGGTERARIDSSGNLLVGKTSADVGTVGHQLLSDAGGDYAAHTSNGNRALLLNRKTSDGEIVDFRKDNTSVGTIRSFGGDLIIQTGITGLRFHDANDAIHPVIANGTVSDGATDLGLTNAKFKDLYLSGKAYVAAMNVDAAANDGIKISSSSPYLFFNDTDTANVYDSSISQSGATLNIGGATPAQTIKFRNKASFAESARIDTSGNLLVGKTAAGHNTKGVQIASNGLTGICTNNTSALFINRKNGDGVLVELKRDNTTKAQIGVLSASAGLDAYFASGSTSSDGAGLRFINVTSSTYIGPCRGDGTISDDLIDLGSSGSRFDDIYATNGTIQTSDRNEKQDIQALTDAEQRVATACKGLIRRYKFNRAVTEKGDDARYHFGIIAQDLQDAFTAEGLDAGDYGMFISSTWTDDNGVEQTRLGVRYNELLAFIIATL